jgi:gamma-glutamyltranspeptidase / glutathione hydrolase
MKSGPSRQLRRLFETAALAATAGGLIAAVPQAGAAPVAKSYAVASESPGATHEAARVLEAGGNAFDAMVSAALISGFSNPSSSGMGGGGFAMLWSARNQKAVVLDFRETAPAGVDAELLDKRPLAENVRGQAVGVPGEVSGLFEMHQRYGRTPWRDLVSRAARLATQGFVVEPHTEGQLEEQKASPIARSPVFRATYFPSNAPAKAGTKVRATKLAATLRLVADQGKRGFYEGRVAQDLVRAVKAAGGSLALTDLSQYQTVERQPLRVTWDDREVLTMPAPSAGGLLLAQVLTLFSPAELAALKDAPSKRIHLLAEAMRGAFADRMRYVADPAFVSADFPKLLAPERMKRRRALLAEDRTHTQPRYGLEEQGTHHLITADAEGNWASLTTTVNGPFGAKVAAEQSGVILNNELEDFTPSANLAVFGMTENPNRPRPGARPTSSMAPTLVLEQGKPVLALGGSGGLTIAPNVTQVLLGLLGGSTPLEAVSAPRFTIPSPKSGQTLNLEAELAKPFGADLEARGELILARNWKNAVQVVSRRGGVFSAAADPRKLGLAEAKNAPAQ